MAGLRVILSTLLACTSLPALAAPNVITDWDEKAVAAVQGNAAFPPRIGPTGGNRIMAVVHLAMFEATNAIDTKYEGYKSAAKPDIGCSQQAAAAKAAATVLIKMHPESAAKTQQELDAYLEKIPAGEGKDRGIKLGEESATKVLALRDDDGYDRPNTYRPRTEPGVYVATVQPVFWEFSDMRPFALASPSQFRPGPPPELKGDTWAKDYNEIKELGGKNSAKRTQRQTEDAKFWLSAGPAMYQPIVRQTVISREMSIVESARFMTIVTTAQMDALIAVFDAKYKYEFWRPMTAIRNGDIDGNNATERLAAWQPLDVTPLHPEYPCAHCVLAGALAGSIEALLGTTNIPEASMTSPTAPGVTHTFTNVRAVSDEVAGARIYAGFHYRYSTVVGTELGMKIGAYVAQNALQPLTIAAK